MASENDRYRGLLVDWGGVLTTDVFDSFRAFCKLEGLAPDAIASAFRDDVDCRDLLIAFETGTLAEGEFEVRFAPFLGVAAPGLIDRLFAGSAPDEEMIEAVRWARSAGIKTGLVSNSWGTRRYPRDLLDELFNSVVISADIGIRKPSPRSTHSAPSGSGWSRRRAYSWTTCRSTSSRPPSSAWPLCTTSGPRRPSPSSSGCWA